MKTSQMKIHIVFTFALVSFGFLTSVSAQSLDIESLKKTINELKTDERGPFSAIRWFCPDGEVLPPQNLCPKPGGVQHGLRKDGIQKLASEHGVHLGQVLAGTDFKEFWDDGRRNSRIKQYELEKFLVLADDGWIMRRARYYRGAIQAEDEEAWGEKFLKWLLADSEAIEGRFFLVRQAVKTIPHKTGADKLGAIRSTAKTIADELPEFADLKAKIHGSPEAGDVDRTKVFLERRKSRLSQEMIDKIRLLIRDMEEYYRPAGPNTLRRYMGKFAAASPITPGLNAVMATYETKPDAESQKTARQKRAKEIADILLVIRQRLLLVTSPDFRLLMMDLSRDLESILFRDLAAWRPDTVGELIQKASISAKACAGCGLVEMWEWQALESALAQPETDAMDAAEFRKITANLRRVTEWGTGMIRAVYDPVASLFSGFEPLALGFVDDRVRSSLLLPLGNATSDLAEVEARKFETTAEFMGLQIQGEVRGLNPGFCLAELEVIAGDPESVAFSDKKIYAMMRAPANLKPVAGIMTVSEGNPVSHVQLLARNLGIPNAVATSRVLNELASFSGKKVLYAVSPGGAVVMKPAEKMNADEKALFEVKVRKEEKIRVPTNKIDLKETGLVPLGRLMASDSGRICGPKAANLGQLKSLFPEMVGEGFIIPFGVFRRHLDLDMPGSGMTYWEYLRETFSDGFRKSVSSGGDDAVEKAVLDRLAELQKGIKSIQFLPGFQESFGKQFSDVLGKPMGKLPVFIRSDTNMEDLKDFTGAGLNLTVFNVAEIEKIWQGIRDVWASPYSERSYKWRQKYLLDPENVYPSILILPTVTVEKSGVMITAGVSSGDSDDITVSFCRGPGGAVEGQAAESYLLRKDGVNLLLSPSRDGQYNILPETGGMAKGFAYFNDPILTTENLDQLRQMANEIKKRLPGTPGIESVGPFDIELGFKDNEIRLFQVRPFVENKRARSSAYLLSIDPKSKKDARVRLADRVR